MAGLGDWARRRVSSGNRQDPVPAASQPTIPSLPPPPAGYAWALHGSNYVLVQLQQVSTPAAPPSIVAPIRQPSGVVPYVPQPITGPLTPGQAGPRIETCVLVKPGDKDPYRDLLCALPDIVPDQSAGFDAMAGRPSPATLAAIQGCSEAIGDATAPNPDAPLRSFPEGSALLQGSTPLKGN